MLHCKHAEMYAKLRLYVLSAGGGALDVADLAEHTEFAGGYHRDHPMIANLWEVCTIHRAEVAVAQCMSWWSTTRAESACDAALQAACRRCLPPRFLLALGWSRQLRRQGKPRLRHRLPSIRKQCREL